MSLIALYFAVYNVTQNLPIDYRILPTQSLLYGFLLPLLLLPTILRFVFSSMWSTWCLHNRLLSEVIPKYSNLYLCSIVCPFKIISGRSASAVKMKMEHMYGSTLECLQIYVEIQICRNCLIISKITLTAICIYF